MDDLANLDLSRDLSTGRLDARDVLGGAAPCGADTYRRHGGSYAIYCALTGVRSAPPGRFPVNMKAVPPLATFYN